MHLRTTRHHRSYAPSCSGIVRSSERQPRNWPQARGRTNADGVERRIGEGRSMRYAGPDSTVSRLPRRRLCVAIALLVLGAGLGASTAAAKVHLPSPYGHGLSQIDAHLRFAIEIRPTEMGEGIRISEVICEMAQRSEERGDDQGAESDWSTLSQAVRELDLPASRAVDAAFERADSDLRALRRRFSLGWREQASKVRELGRGVAQTRKGIQMLRSAVSRIAAAFAEWELRDCAAARNGIESGARRLPAGVERVNRGMQRLWRLLEI